MIKTPESDKSTGTPVPQIVQGNLKLAELEHARQVLQDEIDDHKKQIIDKTRRLNSLVEINCLPPELLAEIFFQWIAATRGASGVSSRKWTRIAHVCHFWREVALSTPRLWGEFTVGQMEWTREMLLRSKQAPLKVSVFSFNLARSDHLEVLRLVFQQLPRVEHIALRNLTGLADQLEPISTAPLLRSLAIHGQYHPPNGQSLLTAFEKMALPKLAHLDLGQTQLPWSSTLLKPSLTRLIFRCSHVKTGPYQNIEFAQVLRVLESMPLLEHLELANVLPTLPNDPELNHYVSLPVLQTLILSTSSKSCAFLLQHLDFPTSTMMQIECWITVASESLLDVTSVIASKLQSSNTGPTRPLRSILCSEDSVRGWYDVLPLCTLAQEYSLISAPEPRLCLSVSPLYHTPSITPVLASLPLQAVQNLMISADDSISKSTNEWLKLFIGMRDVRELGVLGLDPSDDIFKILGQRVPLPASQQKSGKGMRKKGDILLPNLNVISVEDVMFREYMDEPDKDSVIGDLKKMLRTRKTAQRRVERLVIKQATNFDSKDVEELKGLVKEVDWDGDEDFIDEEYGDEDEDEDEDEDDEDEYFDEGGYGDPYWLDNEDMLYNW